jgi:pimeloyl-ACP methyl ester carboxylesterase
MLRRSELSINGARTVVAQSGLEDSDEALVFLHGNPGFSRDWEDLMARAGDFCRCVAPDMPGFGHSDKPESFEYTVAGYARHFGAHDRAQDSQSPSRTARFRRPLGPRMGAFRAVGARKPNPHQYRCPAGLPLASLRAPLVHARNRRGRDGDDDSHWFPLTHPTGQSARLPKEFVDSMFDCFDAGTKRAVLRLYRATDNPSDLADEYGRAFRSWSCPVLVIWGRADPYIASGYAERQREFFPAAQVEVLDQSGHWPHADDPERVAALALPFWRAAASKAPTA